jgi:excisionase family DNA binding protein
MGKVVTAREAAEELGVVERTVRRWIGAGELPAEKERGAYVIDLDAARDVHRRSRGGRSSSQATELAELRGRYKEVSARLAQIERELADERRRVGRLTAILAVPKGPSMPREPDA